MLLVAATIANVSGTALEKSRRTICDFFPKTESDLDQKLRATAWRRRRSSAAPVAKRNSTPQK
jgi:hypothetical protein